ncbi:hypothetical protein BDR06DRAFT_958641 [Suillus hirtellus]|nr:hypothetical protein BDR06DRAFT_958641 [Suillus hirtellus]
MNSPYANVPRPSPRPSPSSRRPLAIAELSERALSNLWDPSKGLKQWLLLPFLCLSRAQQGQRPRIYTSIDLAT